MQLSYQQKREIYEQGFVKVPGVVPQIMIDSAHRAINHSIGQGMNPQDMPILRAQSFCPELTRTEVITQLFNHTPVVGLLESVLGEGNVHPTRGGQIAVRFPGMQDPPHKPMPHLDGMYTPTNGVKEGTIQNFTLLVGVYLSPLRQQNAGNLAVWPGSHRIFEQYFREHGPESLLQGMPKVEMPEPEHVLVEPGDVVIAHYQLAHGTSANVSPNVRYAIYFRVTHPAFDRQRWQDPMTDIWMHWPGMKDIIS